MADKIATRESYGNALAEFGAIYKNLVVLDADLAAATKTGTFKKAFPDRFFDCGIAENNMIAAAVGMSLCGKIPFASTFAMFAAGRSFEQIRNAIGYPHNNVKIGATHAGITVGEDGATHQCNEDIALMRTIPGMVILNPADDTEARLAVKAAIEHDGPVYLRFGRPSVPNFTEEDQKFEIGKAICFNEGTDVTIFATGHLVWESINAAEMLEAEGISAEVIDIATLKPLDVEAVVASAKKTGAVVCAEEHNMCGGLGELIAGVLASNAPTPVEYINGGDRFGQSGTPAQLLKAYDMDAEHIAEAAKRAIARK